jgi:hypothetical protein
VLEYGAGFHDNIQTSSVSKPTCRKEKARILSLFNNHLIHGRVNFTNLLNPFIWIFLFFAFFLGDELELESEEIMLHSKLLFILRNRSLINEKRLF